MFYIYILHSPAFDKYYIGFTDDFNQRLLSHNSTERNTYTKKYRPWKIVAVFECGDDRGFALKVEKFIKKQKSRNLLQKMIGGDKLDGILAQLVPPFGRASLPRISNSLSWRQGGLEKLQKSIPKVRDLFFGINQRVPKVSGSNKRSFKKGLQIIAGLLLFLGLCFTSTFSTPLLSINIT